LNGVLGSQYKSTLLSAPNKMLCFSDMQLLVSHLVQIKLNNEK